MTPADDNLEALLGLSVELVNTMKEAEVEAAKERHPSGNALRDASLPDAPVTTVMAVLNAADRCDNDCSAAALYRVALRQMELDFCHHHKNKYFPEMEKWGWTVVGTNPSLMDELYNTNRLKGGDHA